MNLIPIWASPSTGDFVSHLDLIAVDTFLASTGTDDAGPIRGLNLYLETVVPTWVSPGPGDSRSQMIHTWTW